MLVGASDHKESTEQTLQRRFPGAQSPAWPQQQQGLVPPMASPDQARVLGLDHGAGQRISRMQQGTFRGNMRHEANFVDVGTVHEFQGYVKHFGIEFYYYASIHMM